MNSKEALDYIRHTDEWKDYYSIELELDIIEEDLEILDILKNNEISISYIEQSTSYDDYISKCDHFRCLSYITEEEYTKLKEWLENE